MIREFADHRLLPPHGAVQGIDRLEAADMVERAHSPVDGRSVLVSLTSKGSAAPAAQPVRAWLAPEPRLVEPLARLRQIGSA